MNFVVDEDGDGRRWGKTELREHDEEAEGVECGACRVVEFLGCCPQLDDADGDGDGGVHAAPPLRPPLDLT